MKETYIIKIWETEELRNAGLSDIISFGITDLKTAIKDAKQLMQEQEYASIEVQNSKEKKSYYYEDGQEQEYIYNNEFNSQEERITDVVNTYFAEKDITNLMDYGSDRDYYIMPSLSDLYKGILSRLNIHTYNVATEDISDGKYCTTIDFDEKYSIIVDTSASNSENVVISNIISIQDEYDKFLRQKSQDEYIEVDYEEEMEV